MAEFIDEMKSYNIRLYALRSHHTILVDIKSAKLLDKVPIPRHMRNKVIVVTSTGEWIDGSPVGILNSGLSNHSDLSDLSDQSNLSDLPKSICSSSLYDMSTLDMENTLMGVREDQKVVSTRGQNLHYYLEKGNEIIMCSDGSVSDEFQTGTFGWVVAAIHYGVAIPLLTGAGKCRTQDNIATGNLDSTRMESIGIVSAIRAIKAHQISGVVTLECDNSATVGTYDNHRTLNMGEWQKLEKKDVWGYLDTFQTNTDRQNLEVRWHRGHPEKRMKKSEYTPLDQASVWANALAAAAYSRNTEWCKPWELPTKIP